MDEALRDGRRLTRAGQHAEALARFEEALTIDATPWRVQCEAAFVAWRAENDEAANAHLERAMNGMPPGFVAEEQRAPKAMCLFNAGLVYEAHGQTEDARAAWQESVRLRPNATVEARLAALGPADEELPPWRTMPASAPIAEIVAAMRADFAEHGLAGFEGGHLEADAITLEPQTLGGAPSLEAHVIRGDIRVPAGGEQLVSALVVRAGDVQRVALLGQAYSAGMDGSAAELDAAPSLEDVLPGGQPELVVRVRSWGGSIGYVECWGSERHMILCTTDLGALECISFPIASLSACGESENDEDLPVEGYCREPRFENGSVVLERCREDAGEATPFIEGTHALRALLSRGELRWPDAWTPLEPVGS